MGKPKKTYKLDEQNNILAVYDSAKEAADSIGMGRERIALACREGYRLKGFYWRYADYVETKKLERGGYRKKKVTDNPFCRFYEDNDETARCKALNVMDCDGCKFYKRRLTKNDV